MQNNQSALLSWFYNDYVEWVDKGANEDNPHGFRRDRGLCHNIINWIYSDACPRSIRFVKPERIQQEMNNQFKESNLSPIPFNELEMPYWLESISNICHENKLRIEWVKEHTRKISFWEKVCILFGINLKQRKTNEKRYLIPARQK